MTKLSSAKAVEEILSGIEALDLAPIKFKLMDPEEGYGWSREHADRMEIAYKRFLTLLVKHPDTPIAPSKDVDKFWHGHILDTMKYAEDCERVFGYFLHHFPYFGMRGEDDAAQQTQAADNMRRLYEQEFGEAMGSAAAYCAATKPAYCAATEKADAAYCAAAVKPAYCAATTKAAAAYCAASKPAYCAAAKKADAAYCAATKKADAAYCAASKPAYCAASKGASAAYCAASKPAYCAASKEASAAYCAATKQADTAYCAAGKPAHGGSTCCCIEQAGAAYCAAGKPAYCAASGPDLHTRPTLAVAA